jgi:hypothetical protein
MQLPASSSRKTNRLVYLTFTSFLEEVRDWRIENHDFEVLSTFARLEDANNFVLVRCADYAERDDPDVLFTETVSLDGRTSWMYEDEDELQTAFGIEKCLINAPGSVPAQDWGRPIGAPSPSLEDSEVESSSSSSFDE